MPQPPATEPEPEAQEDAMSPIRHGPGRRESDSLMSVLRAVQKNWAILSGLLTMMLALLIYIHNGDMSRVQALEQNDATLAQQRAINLQRLAVVEDRTLRLERGIEEQNRALKDMVEVQTQILKAVQWQQDTLRRQRSQEDR